MAQTMTKYLLNKHDHLAVAAPKKPKGGSCVAHDDVGRLEIHILGAAALPDVEFTGVPDPYVMVQVGSFGKRTSTKNNDLNPKWNETMVFPVKLPAEEGGFLMVTFEIFDHNLTGNTLMCVGTVQVPTRWAEDSASAHNSPQVMNLVTAKGGDGGCIRYTAALTSIARLQERADKLEGLSRVPVLPKATELLLRGWDEVSDVKDVVLSHAHPKQLIKDGIGVAWSFWTAPARYSLALVKGVLRKAVQFL